MLRREQERIGAGLRAVQSRQAVIESSLDDWQEVMNLARRFSTSCARACRRAGDRTRKLFNTAVIDQVQVRDGHVVEAGYKEPFDLLFSVPKFEYDVVVEVLRRYSNTRDEITKALQLRDVTPVEPVPARAVTPHKLSQRLTEAQVQTLLRGYAEGRYIKDLAVEFGIGTTSVKQLLRRHGATQTRAERLALQSRRQ